MMSSLPSRPGTVGVLLAAGVSRRMGTPKALLPWQGEPLVRHVARALREGGAERVAVVVGPDATGQAIADAIADLPGVFPLVNPNPERGMLSSVQAGMQEAARNLSKVTAWLVCPCDLPLLASDHVAAVLATWDGDDQIIVVPTFGGKRGHPTLFGNYWTTEILSRDAAQAGLNAVLAGHPDAVREAPVADAAVVRDADTPDEWRALLERASSSE